MKYRPTMPHPEVSASLADLIEQGATLATPADVMKAALPHVRALTDALRKTDERSE